MGGAGVGERPFVFVSYSRKDSVWRDRFLEMLAPMLERELEVWSDQREVIGEQWRPQLEEAIARSRAALLLVSPDFLASPFIMEQELPKLLNHGAVPFLVLVRPCLWDRTPLLEERQWAHDPTQALSQVDDRDGAIVRICESLIDRLPTLPPPALRPGGTATLGEVGDGSGPVAALSVAAAGDLVDVPPLPPGFVERDELAAVRAALLRAGTGTVGLTGRGLGLHGQGGIGKTVLAVALARDEDVRRHFPDGVLWVTLGERADLVAAPRDLLILLGADAEVRTTVEGKAALKRALGDRQCLLIVDDVWSSAAAAAFQVTGPHGRVGSVGGTV
jgi:TIR domain/NB-ARC domain